jgi:hypothetical protein
MSTRSVFVRAICLGLTLVSSAAASEYCTQEQYQHDRALIDNAIKTGTIVQGPNAIRNSILVEEGMWFGMNYPKQIAFMQSFECAWGGTGGKKLLYMDVRSLGTGRLLATWTALGALKPAEERPDLTNPGMSGVMEDENRIGLTGEGRAAFIKSVIEECNRRSAQLNCSCYANDMADNLSIKDLKEAGSLGNRDLATTALQPKLEAAAKRCPTN